MRVQILAAYDSTNIQLAAKVGKSILKSTHQSKIHNSKTKQTYSKHYREHVYSSLGGIPNFVQYFEEGDYRVLAIEVLGPTLENLLDYCGRSFTLKTVLQIAIQLVNKLLD